MCCVMQTIMESTYSGMSFGERMDFYKVPALSVCVVEDGNIQTECFGYRDREKKLEADDETLFQAASISKVLLAVVALRLAEAGKINLDEDIRQYTDTDFYRTFDCQQYRVTLKDLLSHTAGFNIGGFAGYLHTMDIPSIEQILRGKYPANNVPLFMENPPGAKWAYSGGGYMLAQKVICDALGMEFEPLMRKWVLSPLGMYQSTFEQPLNTCAHANYACGYDVYDRKIEGGFSIMPELAAAGLWTTPGELALLVMELMRAMRGQSPFLSKESMAAMTTKTVSGAATGLGLFFPDENQEGYYEHSGSNLGYVSEMCFQLKSQKGFVAMVNSSVSGNFLNEMEDIAGRVL